MKLHANTLEAPPPPAPQVVPLQGWSAKVQGWVRMLLAEILCYSSGFKPK